jgi:hypothetical protein
MEQELREFVYLDSMSVNSLLASQQMAIPQTVRDVSENIHEDLDHTDWGFSLGYEGIASLSRNSEDGKTDENRRLAETERRVNDQYRFSILHRSLSEIDKLTDLNKEQANDSESFKLNSGDVVKMSGTCVTDPLYRIFGLMSSLMRISDLEVENKNQHDFDKAIGSQGDSIFDNWKEVLHGERISIKMESDDFDRPILMSIKVNDLWTSSPEREFINSHNYTVVGRVSRVITGKDKWDFVELLRIMGSVTSDDSVDQIRNMFVDNLDQLNETETEGDGFKFDLEADRDDFVVEEPALVIDPIAIYW